MTLTLTTRKQENIINKCNNVLSDKKQKIRNIAKLVGTLVATKEAVPLAPIYYRNIENCKNKALKQNKGNFDSYMKLTEEAKTDIKWWIANIKKLYRNITPRKINNIIYTDASKQGWGAHTKEINTKGR